MRVYLNKDLTEEDLIQLRKVDTNYFPSFRFPSNRTVLVSDHKFIFQIESNLNICEIVLPDSNYNLNVFINSVFSTLLLYICSTLKPCPVKVCNEIGFKIVFYTPSHYSLADSWTEKIGKLDFLLNEKNLTETIWGVKLLNHHNQFILYLHLDSLYQPIHNPKFILKSSASDPSFTSFSTTPSNNTFSTTFSTTPSNNTFGTTSPNNTFGTTSPNNTFATIPSNNTFGTTPNTFGTTSNNTFGTTFATTPNNNTFGSNPTNNTFGSNPNNNTFGTTPTNNTFSTTPTNNTNNTFADNKRLTFESQYKSPFSGYGGYGGF